MKMSRLLERLGDVESSELLIRVLWYVTPGSMDFVWVMFELSYESFLIVETFVWLNFEMFIPLRNWRILLNVL